MKKLSVIIPIYNAEKYLDRCLFSILSQDIDSFEIVAVNDGSKDKSINILEEYQKKYPKIMKIVNQQNAGVSVARNTGIQHSDGEYITFLDSDDYLEPNSYKKVLNKIDNGYDIVIYDYCRDYGHKKERKYVLFNGKEAKVNVHDYLLSLPGTWNKCMKRDLFIKNNLKFPEGKWYEDLAIIPQLALYTDKIYYLPELVVNYYQSDDSITRHEEFKTNSLTIFDSLDCLYHTFKNTDYINEIEYLYIYHLLIESSLYFYRFGKYQYIDRISSVMKSRFPNWKKNKLLNQLDKKSRLFANLFYNRQYVVIKLFQRIKKLLEVFK